MSIWVDFGKVSRAVVLGISGRGDVGLLLKVSGGPGVILGWIECGMEGL